MPHGLDSMFLPYKNDSLIIQEEENDTTPTEMLEENQKLLELERRKIGEKIFSSLDGP